MTTAAEFERVPKELFDRAWEIVKACDDREKHFNTLQSHYRTLASTWLLAAFGAMGFILSTTLNTALPRFTMIVAIAVAASLGLALLWVLDVLVYHELLIVGYIAGQQLENAFDWLPPIRSHFGKERQPLPVRTFVGLFYAGGILALACGAGLTLLASGNLTLRRGLLLFFVTCGILLLMYYLTRQALAWRTNLPLWIQPPPRSSAVHQV